MEMFVTGSLKGRIVKLQQGFSAYQIPQLKIQEITSMLGPLIAITDQATVIKSSFSTQPSPALHLVPMKETASASLVK